MPRKNEKMDERHFYGQVVQAMKYTTPQERFEIARAWCMRFEKPDDLAHRINLPPIAILVASMVDIQHPLVSSMRTNISVTSCAIDIITAELRGLPVAIPVCTHPTVDDLCTPVDNCQFVHRAEVKI